ncbi:MAG: hypothetical protein ACKVU1_02215 [bacterium]
MTQRFDIIRATHRAKAPSRAAGSSLIEVMIASFLVGVVSLMMVEFFARGRYSIDQEERKRAATLLAQDALEKATATEYAMIGDTNEQRTVANVQYTIDVTVEDDEPGLGMKSLESSVTWQGAEGTARNVTLNTIVYNPE